MLEQAGISQEVEIEAEGNALILRPVQKMARQGWEKAFQTMAERGDDQRLDDTEGLATEWERNEWEWK